MAGLPPKRPRLDDDFEDDEDFGFILPSLIRQLKNILNQYPDNDQIIKEIVQNAEDAGASVVKFLYDENDKETLFSQGKEELKGPALYAYNDAYFEEKDWRGIRMLGESLKEKDPIKVGKFGLGFKSVFHMTDNPVIMSGQKFGIINPDEMLFSVANERRTGKFLNFEKQRPITSHHKDRVEVYKDVLSVDADQGRCKGTVFRFTLRKEPSQLSETIYSATRMDRLLNSFKSEGHLSLMFLKNLEKIEFYIRRKGSNHAEHLYSFAAEQESRESTREEEKTFMQKIRKAHNSDSSLELSLVKHVTIVSDVFQPEKTSSKAEYFILNYYAGELLEQENEFTTIEQAKKLGFIPLVGVACPVSHEKSISGHVFCALPLPILHEKTTRLPVHVNGFFALGPDRKDLKWPAADEATSNDKDVSWNLFLTRKVLPRAYIKLFLHLKEQNLPGPAVYNALPDVQHVDYKWERFAHEVLLKIFKEDCIWSDAVSSWISIPNASFKDKTKIGHEAAYNFLKKCRFPVACVAEHMVQNMEALGLQLNKFSPENVRNGANKNALILQQLSDRERIDLLHYMLQVPEDILSLYGVPILPLEDGHFVSPQLPSNTKEQLFITSSEHSKELVPGCESFIIKTGIPDDLVRKILSIVNKGLCQVKALDQSNLASLLKTVLPPSNFQSRMIVSSQELSILPFSWFTLIWGYINKYGILEQFEGLPLIPLCKGSNIREIAVLRKNSLFIYNQDNGSDEVLQLLEHLGFTILKELPEYVLQNSSVFKKMFIHEFKDENLGMLLLNLSSQVGSSEMIKRFFAFDNNQAKLSLSKKLVRLTLTAETMQVIKVLPINENTETQQLVSIQDCVLIAPQGLPARMPSKMLLKAKDDAQCSFMTRLGATLLSKPRLIMDILLPELEKKTVIDENDDLMIKYIFDTIATCEREQCHNIIVRLRDVRFVMSDDGERYVARDLFNPAKSLVDLFTEEKGRFPKEKGNLEVLRMLGLKKEADVTGGDVNRCLTTLCCMADINNKEAKAKRILDHLQNHQRLLSDQTLIAEMNAKPWIPIRKDKPYLYPNCLTWFAEKNQKIHFERPCMMHFEKNSNSVGCVKAVIRSEFEKFSAIQILKKDDPLDIQDVVYQLHQVVNDYSNTQRNKFVILLKDIYQCIQANKATLKPPQKEYLEKETWVWSGNGFVTPKQIVLNENSLDLRPHIYNLPQDVHESKSLFSNFGAIDSINEQHLINVLYTIKDLHDNQINSFENVERDRKICQSILQHLGQMNLSEQDLVKILVPVRSEEAKLHLVASSQTVYSSNGGFIDDECDDDDMGDDAGEVFFLHECITEEMATSLHIRSLTSKLIGAEDLGIFEEYGQNEPLTRRINRILEDYGDGFAIVKELIQNADDAGAVVMKLLYDERLNKDKLKYLIDPGMKDFQGPALWAFNDAKFSKEDFDNIVKLSGATKEDKRDKIGRFGLGFNAVYNITDVPSFISDNQLVILDPHTTNLGSAIKNKSKPGVKIPLGPKRNRLRRFEDQINIYDGVFGMDASLNDGYRMFDGTLFRFPLRTKKQAQSSEIKRLFYSKGEMKDLLKKFASEANRMLLFTQNVCKVEFFHLNENAESAKDMQLLIQISKIIYHPDLERNIQRASRCTSFDIMRQSSQLVESKARNKQMNLMTNESRNVIDVVTRTERKAVDEFEIERNCNKETWLLHSLIDDKDCMKMALKNVQLNPVATVAVRIPENDSRLRKDEADIKGYFYCFLPLPIPNGLQVHVNSTFAVTKDRKSFQERSEDDKKYETVETIWNRKLMSGPVPLAYVGVLKDLTSLLQKENEETWYRLWPEINAVKSKACSYNKELINGFYMEVIHKKVNIFPKPGIKNEWLNWSEIRIIDGHVRNQQIQQMMEDVFALFRQEQVIIHIPEELISTITDAGFQYDLSRIVLSFPEFFTRVFMPNLKDTRLNVQVRDEILLFAIKEFSSDPSVSQSISQHECVPTTPFGRLKKPKDLVRPGSKAADLFEEYEEVFPSNNFKDCFSQLVEFGMLYDDITWELLIKRARTVNQLDACKIKEALKRTTKILQLVGEKATTSDRNESPSWENIKFLPVKSKPSGWGCLNWEGEKSGEKFTSPENIFASRLENEVGCHQLIFDDYATRGIDRRVEKLLGMRTLATIPDIARQVEIIAKCINEAGESELPTILPSVFDSIYRTLASEIAKNPGSREYIQVLFRGKDVILTDDNTLVKSEQVAFLLNYNAKPYLYKLRSELAMRYNEIMSVLNVRENFVMEDFQRALMSLKDDAGGEPLNDSQLKTVRALLESIKAECSHDSEKSNVCLPDKDGVLHPKEMVAVKETVWMQNDRRKRYLHDSIPPHLALALGAKTARSHSIASQSRGLPFGQHEKLTVRLKRILEAYPSQIQILYELLQNADDAGAKEVKFVLDKRTHRCERVFGDAWKPLQGPALLVFNDAPFTQRDLEGIQNLGEGSKGDDSEKTGQYGIGLNVVYHVTDVPSLLTSVDDESVLCIFDPHARFLEECSQAEPGRMFTDGRNYLRDTFRDIYNTFLPDFLTNEQSAILRLPLRTKSHALNSAIKQLPTTTEEILQMFDSFKDKGPEAIIFLRNVRSVELYVIDETDQPHCLFSIQAKMSSNARNASTMLNKDCKSLSAGIRERNYSKRSYTPFQYELKLTCSRQALKKWTIIQKCASINPEDLPPSIESQYQNGKLPLIPVGGISCKSNGEKIDGKVYCLLPLAVSSSLPVHINGKFILDYESRRRLWYTNDESFQKDWNYYIIENCIIPCYVELMKSLADLLIVKADETGVLGMLHDAFQVEANHAKNIDIYFKHFPKLLGNTKAHEYDADLVKMFYKKLTSEEVPVMPVLRPSSNELKVEFFPPNTTAKQFYVTDFKDQGKFIQEKSPNICIALIEIGMNIYNVPTDVVQGFSHSDVPLQKLTPKIVADFLKTNSSEVLQGREAIQLQHSVFKEMKTIDALLQYCMKDEAFQLDGVPLLVTEDEFLRRFDDSKHVFYDELSILFPSKKNYTLHRNLRSTLIDHMKDGSGPLRKFMLADFSEMLDTELQACFKEKDEIDVIHKESLDASLPTHGWLRNAWNFLRKRYEEWKTRHVYNEKQRVAEETERKIQQLKRNAKSFRYRDVKIVCRTPEEMGVTQEAFLGPISNWCLFPVERHVQNKSTPKRYFLIRINKASTSVDCGEISHIINELGLPVPSSFLVDNSESYVKSNQDFLLKMAATTNNPNALIDAFYHDLQRDSSGSSRLTVETAKALLDCFRWKTNCIGSTGRHRLMTLPVWEDLSKNLKSISSVKVYLIDDDMPHDGTAFLQEKENAVLLKRHFDLDELYKWMDFESWGNIHVYCHLILKHFSDLQPKERFAHLEFLKKKYLNNNELDPALLNALKNTKIIEKNGGISYASDFFDPDIELLTVMLPKTEFPPDEYRDYIWLHFLRYIGLISMVSTDLFSTFAKSLESVKELNERRGKSGALVKHLRDSDELKEDERFLYEISSIPFLVADKYDERLTKIVPAKNEENLLCFNDSLKHSDRNITLTWAVENILPNYASQSPFFKPLPYKQLNVKADVPSYSVARNLSEVVQSSLMSSVAKGVEKYSPDCCIQMGIIFETAYNFLKAAKDDETVKLLRSIPFILTGDDLVSIAERVTLEQGFNIRPYLFSMPTTLGKFVDLFKDIGMSEKPTINQLVEVLNNMYSNTAEKPLDPNEARNVVKVIYRLIDLVENEDCFSNIITLPLPGAYGRKLSTASLFKSQELIYFDDTHLENRLEKLSRPRLHLKITQEQGSSTMENLSRQAVSQFIGKIPAELRPTKISDFVREEMLDAETLPNDGFTKDLQDKMNSRQFAECIIRLLKHQANGGSEDDQGSIHKILELLSLIHVVTKERVQTVLYQSDELKIEDSECDKDVFIENKTNMLHIYIKSSLTEKADTIGAVASEMVAFFGNLFKDPKLSPLLNTLLDKDPQTMHEFLDKQGICRDFEDLASLTGRFYRVGAFVPIDLHFILINDITKFDAGDYVAYEVEDPGLDNKDGDPVYIYARIVERITQGEQKDFYKIDIGLDDPKIVHKSELYGFCRPENFKEEDQAEPESFEEVIESIRRELEEAFRHGEACAKKIIKRLWLKWHPDKNPGREEFCTEVFKFIQAEVKRLRGDSKDGFWTSQESRGRYFQRGRRFVSKRRNFSSQSNSGYTWSNGYWRASDNKKNPQPGEARRWYRQANYDLNAAKSDVDGGDYEWVCFKCHQAAEKGLKAAVYMKDSERANHHHLGQIAKATENSLLPRLAIELESLLVGSAALRYPDRWCYPGIPHDKYDKEKAQMALKITQQIMVEVESIVN